MTRPVKLKMLPVDQYRGVNRTDPLRFYSWPVIGALYRRRVESCLAELRGGDRILEVGFGSGVTFLNLHALYGEIHGLDLETPVEEVTAVFNALQIPTDLRNGDVLNMPYADDLFDGVLLISILEHLQPGEQVKAIREIKRVLKPGGQVVYGVPVERPFMAFMFRLLGYNIRQYHFSTEKDVAQAAQDALQMVRILPLKTPFGSVYQIGHFVKNRQ